MKTRWLPVFAVALIAGTLITYKQLQRDSRPESNRGKAPVANVSGPSILLFADPREADGTDPCAEIFRLVRRAGARGLRVREFASGAASEATRQYHVTVEPTVLVLDASGRVVARHEGESPEVIRALQSSLERLFPAR